MGKNRYLAYIAILMVMAGSALSAPLEPVAISGSIIRAHLEYLAGDVTRGRGTGDRGNELAAKYIADHFRRWGLEPIGTSRQRDPSAPMDGKGYYQPFLFPAGSQRSRDNNHLSIIAGGSTRKWTLGRDFEPSTASSTGNVVADVAFAGYGIRGATRDDYAGLDAKGKIVVAVLPPEDPNARPRFRGMEVFRRVQSARDAGAVALLLGLAGPDDKPTFSAVTRAMDSGLPVVSVRQSVVADILKAAGKDPSLVLNSVADSPASFDTGIKASVQTEVTKVEEPSANIIGLLPGSDPELAKEYVVIGAHMDHLGMGGPGSLNAGGGPAVHYGADDNASGTAGLLMLAEYFATRPVRPKRSLVFMAFSGEELGLLGSAHYTKSPILPLDKTVAMLNLDMIGRLQNNQLTVIGIGSSSIWDPLLDEVNKTASFQMSRSNIGIGGSDHQSFDRARVPVLFFFSGMHPDYHRPSDTVEKINIMDEVRIVEMVAVIADRVANTPERPDYREPSTRAGMAANPAPRGPRVSVGIIPEYSSDAAGLPVSGVRAGGPAEKAGIKAGDVIIKVAGKSVRNIEDYMAALTDLEPGAKTEVVVRRNGKEITVTVTLAESVR